MNNIEKTLEFLRESFNKMEDYKEREKYILYRVEHSIRVANIGRQIALKENLDVEALTIGCLLHDIGYTAKLVTEEDYNNHGRISAKISRPFIQSLGYDEAKVHEICYGIAIHADGKSDFEGENTPLAVSIGDADNIDRFDALRIFMDLEGRNFFEMPIDEKVGMITKMNERLNKYMDLEFGTQAGLEMWREKLRYRMEYNNRLLNQFANSKNIVE